MSPAHATATSTTELFLVAAAAAATTTTTSDMFETIDGSSDENININNNNNNATMTKFTKRTINVMNYSSIIAIITMLLCGCTLFATVDGLKCQMCGQYNEGVGSITPCLNYSDQHAHLYLKECSKKSEKFCVKYVSELSTVRDCATECIEKEIWATQTYCCNQDGCNAGNRLELTNVLMMLLLPILYIVGKEIVLHTQLARR